MSYHLVSPERYRLAQRVGPQLFIAGQVPLNTESSLVGIGEPKAQAKQCLDNLDTLIRQNEFNLSDIRQIVVYVTGKQQNLESAWEGVVQWFDGETPPATLLGVSKLGYKDQIVEIDATIVKDIERVV